MADQFLIRAPLVLASGADVSPEQVQAALNSIAQQVTAALNQIVGEPEPPSGPAGGDLSGTYPNPGVAKVNGIAAGTMANQNANAVAITGGTIAGAAISGGTVAPGTPIAVAGGGTGQNSLSAHNVLLGEGTATVGFAAPGASGQILASTGTAADPSFQTKAALSLAASGANSDITSLAGLTTALSIAQGGTGSDTAPGALTALGAAESGANSSITSLSGLTTALSIPQGGTGAITAGAALTALGAAASGANGDITSLTALTAVPSIVAALAGSATQNFSVKDATSANQAVAYDQVYGLGQSWQLVTGSRAFGTVYTNTTNRPIEVSVTGANTAAGGLSLAVNGVQASVNSAPAGSNTMVLGTVPAGQTYEVSVTFGTVVLNSWSELR